MSEFKIKLKLQPHSKSGKHMEDDLFRGDEDFVVFVG